MKKPQSTRRGFALLIVMTIVALISISSAALLDIVNIDINIASEYAKAIDAEAASVGAVLETVGVSNFQNRLPAPNSPTLRTKYVERNSDGYVLDPAAVFQTLTLTEANSVHISGVGTYGESGYESDVRFIKLVPMEDTTLSQLIPVYEVRAKASVSGGKATREARALIYMPIPVDASRIPLQRHAR
ncbi:MAG: hypothetical protein KTR25_11060 [Myxococcales bacterium]|nr:hypothetical protein [Myxococcales bacterium]